MIRKFIDSDYHSWYSVHMKIIITLIKEDGVCKMVTIFIGATVVVYGLLMKHVLKNVSKPQATQLNK